MDEIEYRHVSLGQLETRLADDEDGTFAGYANRADVEDSYGTHFAPGAWQAGGLRAETSTVYLWMHSPDEPVGIFTAREDETGLWIEGRYDDTDAGERARRRARSGSAPELSVGFIRRSVDAENENRITAAELKEVSQITLGFASQPGAELAAVRKAAEIMAEADEDGESEGAVRRDAMEREMRSWPAVVGSYEDRVARCRRAIDAWAHGRYALADKPDLWVSVEATFSDSVVATIGVWGGTEVQDTWRFPYEVDAESDVNLGQPTRAEVVATIRKDSTEVEARTITDAPPTEPDTERKRKVALAQLKLAKVG